MTSQDFAKFIRAQTAKWSKVGARSEDRGALIARMRHHWLRSTAPNQGKASFCTLNIGSPRIQ